MDNEKTLVQKKKILPTLGKNKKFSVTLFFKKKSKLEHYRHNTLFMVSAKDLDVFYGHHIYDDRSLQKNAKTRIYLLMYKL